MSPTCKQANKRSTCFRRLSQRIDADRVDKRAPIMILCFSLIHEWCFLVHSICLNLPSPARPGGSCRIGKPVAMTKDAVSANSNSLPSSGWKAADRDLLFWAHQIDSAAVFNLNGEQSQLSADQTEMQSLFWGENRAKAETCGCGCNLCGSSAKKWGRDDHRQPQVVLP